MRRPCHRQAPRSGGTATENTGGRLGLLPPPRAAELGFTRVRHSISWPKSDKSDFGGGVGRGRPGPLLRQDSERFRFVPRTLQPSRETLLLRPFIASTVGAEGRENMVPRRASTPRTDARLFSFAAARPTVGFVHGAADLNPLDEAAPQTNVEITERRRGIPFLHRHAFWLAA